MRSHDFLVFDLDGTLSDPLEGIGRSINHALAHFGYAQLPLPELARHIGPPLHDAFTFLTGDSSRVTLDALVLKYRERYGELGYAENVLYPGIPDAIGALAQAGIPMGVCTSKRADFAERILEMFGLRQYFQFVSGGVDGTPKWQQLQGLVDNGRVSPSAVMIGDRAVDMMAAHRNGLHAAGVLWGHGSRVELEGEKPHYLLSNPGELLHFAAGAES
jgi:phosphoglycolate phosphatase